jgi:hypothetical protein
MSKSTDVKVVHARLLILDLSSQSIPIVTQLSLWTHPKQYSPFPPLLLAKCILSNMGSPPLCPHVQERVIERGKQIICQMHVYATHLMHNYNDSYVNNELNEDLGVKLRFRMAALGDREC